MTESENANIIGSSVVITLGTFILLIFISDIPTYYKGFSFLKSSVQSRLTRSEKAQLMWNQVLSQVQVQEQTSVQRESITHEGNTTKIERVVMQKWTNFTHTTYQSAHSHRPAYYTTSDNHIANDRKQFTSHR